MRSFNGTMPRRSTFPNTYQLMAGAMPAGVNFAFFGLTNVWSGGLLDSKILPVLALLV